MDICCLCWKIQTCKSIIDFLEAVKILVLSYRDEAKLLPAKVTDSPLVVQLDELFRVWRCTLIFVYERVLGFTYKRISLLSDFV